MAANTKTNLIQVATTIQKFLLKNFPVYFCACNTNKIIIMYEKAEYKDLMP
jgi:hypothetical protein